MHIFAVLGSNAALSLAELETVLHSDALEFTDEVALFDADQVNLLDLQHRLGGVQKLGEITGSTRLGSKDELAKFLAYELSQVETTGKVPFGITFFELEKHTRGNELSQIRKQLGMEVKAALKEFGRSARYVVSKSPQLTTVDVAKNKLVEKGAEFVLFIKEKEILIGKTVCVQDFEDWGKRDFDRPARNARRGMLPPKLARMMVNLSGVRAAEATLYDPFCGSGTVLMEGAQVGFTQLIGSDISEEAVVDTEENLAWLQDEGYEIPKTILHTTTAKNASALVAHESVDAIVTEPFLGRPRQGTETEEQVERAIFEMTELYTESFASLVKVLKPGGVMVVASPVHFIGEDPYPVPTREILSKLGLEEWSPASEPILYRREGQFVGREIVRFRKK